MYLMLHNRSIAQPPPLRKLFGLVMAGKRGYNTPMWRKVLCAVAFLASIYLLAAAYMQAWLTAADPDAVEQHRLWAYAFLGLALLCYIGFGVLLRPRSVLHFVLCSLAVPAAIISAMAVQHQGWCTAWPALLVVSCGYLLWRVWMALNPK